MCLNKVSEIDSIEMQDEMTCYKAFTMHDDAMRGCIRDEYQFVSGKNVNAEEPKTLTSDGGEEYPSGFHCFMTKEDAEGWIKALRPFDKWHIHEISVKKENVVAVGYQKDKVSDKVCLVVSVMAAHVLTISSRITAKLVLTKN